MRCVSQHLHESSGADSFTLKTNANCKNTNNNICEKNVYTVVLFSSDAFGDVSTDISCVSQHLIKVCRVTVHRATAGSSSFLNWDREGPGTFCNEQLSKFLGCHHRGSSCRTSCFLIVRRHRKQTCRRWVQTPQQTLACLHPAAPWRSPECVALKKETVYHSNVQKLV